MANNVEGGGGFTAKKFKSILKPDRLNDPNYRAKVEQARSMLTDNVEGDATLATTPEGWEELKRRENLFADPEEITLLLNQDE